MIQAVPGVTGVSQAEADTLLVTLYRAHYRPLVRLASLLLDDVGAAEEVVQEAFIKAHTGWRRLRDADRAEPYLRQAVVNGARSRLRRRLVARKHAPKPMPHAPSAEEGALDVLDRDTVVAALARLPRRQREAVVLRFYGQLTEAEIAAAMGISAGSVKAHVSRGTAALATLLGAR